MTACANCCIVEEYSSKKILVKHAEGLMNISYQRENGNKRRTWLEQFVHWAVDRPLGQGRKLIVWVHVLSMYQMCFDNNFSTLYTLCT